MISLGEPPDLYGPTGSEYGPKDPDTLALDPRKVSSITRASQQFCVASILILATA